MTLSVVFDTETDGLMPSVIHCLAIHCIELGESYVFADYEGYNPIKDGLDILSAADWLIAHNGKAYDIPHLERLYPSFLIEDKSKVLDTLLLARSYFPDLKGHKLDDWGKRLGLLKGSLGPNPDWKVFTHKMAEYCLQDVTVTTLLYEVLMEAALEAKPV